MDMTIRLFACSLLFVFEAGRESGPGRRSRQI
jgi:hypothetical protein